jgi:hypothetical protein
MTPRLIACLALISILTAAGRIPGRAASPSPVRVRVTDAQSGELMPCRLTIVDQRGHLASLTAEKAPWIASRQGVVYTGTGIAAFSIEPGRYTLHATRGLEYGLASKPLTVGEGTASVELKLQREVDTSGYICADTHIHTLTFSGHGDATLEERMATIAGEGIELAISTDHNHHTDFAPAAKATRTDGFFTPVIGNEVTTKAGHFNAFPIRPGSRVPNDKLTDWPALLAEIRATPGVRVVTLNHPSNNHSNFIPTDPKQFHPGSGEALDGRPWSFDGIEVVTSAALQSDWMKPYRDWFALLNRGHRMAGVGSSDSHDVDRFILGQGRTYIASTATRADRIDVDQVCDSFLTGKVLASMGLLTEMWVGSAGVGELATGIGERMKVRVRVQGPRWITADRLELFANGEKVLSRPIVHGERAVVKADLTLDLPRAAHDGWLVAVASGPGVSEPYWPIPRPYQPDRTEWDPRVVGSTDPIRIDGDGDGRYTSPLEYARRIVEGGGGAPEKIVQALASYDTAVATQAASVCRARGLDLRSAPFRRAIEGAAPPVRHGFVAYLNMLRE